MKMNGKIVLLLLLAGWFCGIRPALAKWPKHGAYRFSKSQRWDSWVRQEQETPKYRFEVSGTNNPHNSMYGYVVEAIKIINKKTGAVQMLTHLQTPAGDLKDVVQVQDCNFDGQPDFWIFAHTGGAGPNGGNNYYLYNSKTQKFEYNEQLSDLTQPYIDSIAQTITSGFRDGCCHHGGATYTFKNGQLDTLSTWGSQWGYSGIFTEHTTGKKVDGQWAYKTTYSTTTQQDTSLLRSAPKKNSKIINRMGKETRLKIRKETPLWFDVSAEDTQGDSARGWLKKSALFTKKRIRLSGQSEKYRLFALSEDSSRVEAFEIERKKSGKTIQIIPCYQNIYYAEHFFETEDYNNDGLEDFRIKLYKDASGKVVYQYFLFDKSKGLFEREKTPAGTP